MTQPNSTIEVDSTDGVTIALHDFGGSGPDLIICHATGFHGRAYAPMIRPLLAHHHVWAIDLRGHGASTPPVSGDFAWRGMAEDLLACLDAMGTESVLAFGHSLGGATILLAELMRPGVVRAAYTYEPIVFPREALDERVKNPMSEAARNRREVFASKAEALMRYAVRSPLDVLRADSLAAYVHGGFDELPDGTVRLACRAEHEARTFECAERGTIDRLGHISAPITVGTGVNGQGHTPGDFAEMIVKKLRNSRLVRYPLLDHFGPFESPDRIAADVVQALAEAEPS